MKNPIELGPYARPIDRGSDVGPIPLGSSVMTQASGVPKWGAGVGHGSEAQAPRVCCGVPSPGKQPKRHMAQGCAQHWGMT
jgi:hypothetical protein